MFSYKLAIFIFFSFFNLIDFTSSDNAQPLAAAPAPKRRLKILVYCPAMSFSHSQLMGAIADTLQEAGHELHFFKPILNPNLRNKNETQLVKHIYTPQPRFVDFSKYAVEDTDSVKNAFAGIWPTISAFGHPTVDFLPLFNSICEEMVKSTDILDQLTNEHFDVAIGEMYDYCTMAILHRIGAHTKLAAYAIPPMQLVAHRFGIPGFASFMPNINVPSTSPLESSFFARLFNFYNEFYDWLRFDQLHLDSQDPLIREAFGPEFPSLRAITKNVSLAFFNSNPFFEFTRPTSNKLIHIGGLVDQRKQKKQNLDEKFKQILDNAKHGAVLFSFGTIIDTRQMSAKMLRAIVRAFAAFPQVEFIWKLNKETIENNSALFVKAPNVHVFDWIAQADILQHPNLRAFISHCGQNSITEAARSGVPIIGIPLFGDQLYNSIMVREKEMAVHLDVRKLSDGGENAENVLISAIKTIFNDTKYRQNAGLIKKKLELTPFKPSENVIRWVEFAAEFPDLNELNLPDDDDMHWTVYYSLDVIGFTIFVPMAILWLSLKCAKLGIGLAWRLDGTNSIEAKLKAQ